MSGGDEASQFRMTSWVKPGLEGNGLFLKAKEPSDGAQLGVGSAGLLILELGLKLGKPVNKESGPKSSLQNWGSFLSWA